MSLTAALVLVILFSSVLWSVYWVWSGPRQHSAFLHNTSGSGIEGSPEWGALVAQRREIEQDPTLDDATRQELIEGWHQMADQTRAVVNRHPVLANDLNVAPSFGKRWALALALLGLALGLTYMVGGIHGSSFEYRAGSQNGLDSGPLAQVGDTGSAAGQGLSADQALAAGKGHPGDGQPLEARIEALQTRLKTNPEDVNGWVLLSRTQAALTQYADSAQSLRKALALVPDHPALLADLADMLAMSNNRSMEGEPTQLVSKALQGDPTHEKSLALAATAAEQRGDTKAAQAFWARLTEVEQANLATSNNAPNSAPNNAAGQVAAGGLLTVNIGLNPAQLQSVQAQSVLFVFLKAEAGPGMPLAAVRVPAASLQPGINSVDLKEANLLQSRKLADLPDNLYLQVRLAVNGTPDPNPADSLSAWQKVEKSKLGQGQAFDVTLQTSK
ncbi:MAG: hypothetical protein QE278_07020 [Limnobacter sp.]|nr:hypothetical protein [Limnobacter sp.]